MNIQNSHDNSQLVKRLQRGDKAAFEKIYHRFHGNLYFYTLKFVKSGEIAEEIVQDVFMKVWEIRKDIQPGLSLTSFLFTICKNHILNMLNRAATDLSVRKEIARHILTAANDVEATIIRQEYREIMDEAVGQLPPVRQLVFKMCKFEGKSYDEVAEALAIKKGTVKDHMAKALKFVKGYLSEHAEISFLILFGLLD